MLMTRANGVSQPPAALHVAMRSFLHDEIADFDLGVLCSFGVKLLLVLMSNVSSMHC